MDAIVGAEEGEHAAFGIDRHLKAFFGVFGLVVEPDGVGVAPTFEDDVGTWDDIEFWAIPGESVFGGGVTGLSGAVPGVVPHLEEAIFWVPPDAITERHGTGF